MIVQFVLLALIVILVSAVCSMIEAALYSLPASHLEILKKTKHPSAPVLARLKKDIHQPITAILTLNTVANTMGAVLVGAAAASLFGEHLLGWFSLAFTFMILIFAEILPKTIGVHYCRPLAPFIALPLSWLVTACKPLIWFLQRLASAFAVPTAQLDSSTEEILAIASMSLKAGSIAPHQEKVIINIVGLRRKTVRQVMTPRTVTFSLDGALSVAKAYARRDQLDTHSRIPVYEGRPDNVTGIVLRRDILLNYAEDNENLPLASLKKPVHFVPETAPLDRVMLDFIERRQHLFVVVDEYGTVTGVISLEDVIEEIVGKEIVDESDRAQDMRELARSRQRQRYRGKATPSPQGRRSGGGTLPPAGVQD